MLKSYKNKYNMLNSQVLCRWVLSVKKNYRPVKYHNWRHALNVAQTMFAMLKTGKMEQFMTDLEVSKQYHCSYVLEDRSLKFKLQHRHLEF